MKSPRTRKSVHPVLVILILGIQLVIIARIFGHHLLFAPSHEVSQPFAELSGFTQWEIDGEFTGWSRIKAPHSTIWLMFHGNGGQASDRFFVESCFDSSANLFILEYPGYGERKGIPSEHSFNRVAQKAYDDLRSRYPKNKIVIVSESIGCGPACYVAEHNPSLKKLVLIVPFDRMLDFSREQYPHLPIKLMIGSPWDNVRALSKFSGDVEIYGGKYDDIVPVKYAQKLAESNPRFRFHQIMCGHNEWPGFVSLREPK